MTFITLLFLAVMLVPEGPTPTPADPQTETAATDTPEPVSAQPTAGSPAEEPRLRGSIEWLTLAEARRRSEAAGRPVVRFVTMRAGCAPCVYLDRVLLGDPRVIELLSQEAFCVKDYTAVKPKRGRPWMRVEWADGPWKDYRITERTPEAFAGSMSVVLATHSKPLDSGPYTPPSR